MLEIIKEFAEIFNEACELGGGHVLSISPLKEKGDSHQVTASSLYYDTERKIKEALKRPETEFLVSPVIEAAMNQLPYIYPLTMRDVLENNDVVMAKAKKITDLCNELRADAAYEQWQEVANNIRHFSEQFSVQVDTEQLNDLAESSDILLDALLIPAKWKRQKLWRGVNSDSKPVIYWHMPKFNTLADFCDCFRKVEAESCIAFAYIDTRVSDTVDDFEKWKDGRDSELVYNTRRNGGTEDSSYNQSCVIGVKRGENIWVLREHLDHYNNPSRNHSFYQYGRRSSYMPYQVSFPDADAATTALTVRGQATWDTRSIFDEEQAIWIPTALSAVERAFFREPLDESEELTLMGKAIAIKTGVTKDTTALAIRKQYALPDAMRVPEDIFSFASNAELLDILHVTQDDLCDVPFSFSDIDSIKESEMNSRLWNRARSALAVIAKRRWEQDYIDTENAGQEKIYRSWHNPVPREDRFFSWTYKQKCAANIENIFLALRDKTSRISQIADIVVDGMSYEHEKYGVMQTSIQKTSIDDGRPYRNDVRPWFFFPSTIEGKRPAVSIKIRPQNAHDLALLMGVDFETMDWRFRLWNRNKEDWREHERGRDDPMNNVTNSYDDNNMEISIAMGKTEYKKRIGGIK